MSHEREFIIPPGAIDEFLGIHSHERFTVSQKYEDISKSNVNTQVTKLEDVKEKLKRDAQDILNNNNFDVLFSVVGKSNQLSVEVRNLILTILQVGLSGISTTIHKVLSATVTDNEQFNNRIKYLRNSLKIYVYFTQLYVQQQRAREKENAKKTEATSTGKGRKTKQKADSDDQWDSEAHKERLLTVLHNLLEMELGRLWKLNHPEEELMNLFERIGIDLIENQVNMKKSSLKSSIFAMMGVLIRKYPFPTFTERMVHLLCNSETLSTHLAELYSEHVTKSDKYNLIPDMLKEIANTINKDDNRKEDSKIANSLSTFLSELAHFSPALMVGQWTYLSSFLNHESYVLRNAVIDSIGYMMVGGFPEERQNSAAIKSDMFDILYDRHKDVNAFCRARVMKTFAYMAKHGESGIPFAKFNEVTRLAISRVSDKAAATRKNAFQLLTALVVNNRFFSENLTRPRFLQYIEILRSISNDLREQALVIKKEHNLQGSMYQKKNRKNNQQDDEEDDDEDEEKEDEDEEKDKDEEEKEEQEEEEEGDEEEGSNRKKKINKKNNNKNKKKKGNQESDEEMKTSDSEEEEEQSNDEDEEEEEEEEDKMEVEDKKKPKKKKRNNNYSDIRFNFYDEYLDKLKIQREVYLNFLKEFYGNMPQEEVAKQVNVPMHRQLLYLNRSKNLAIKGLEFVDLINSSMDTIGELMGSVTNTDIVESISFFKSAVFYKFERLVNEGESKMLMLIQHKEQAVREAIIDAFKDILLTSPAQSSKRHYMVAKNLIDATKNKTLGEISSLEDLIIEFLKKDKSEKRTEEYIGESLKNALWDIYAGKVKNFGIEERRGAIVIISMIAGYDKSMIIGKEQVLINVGLLNDQFPRDEFILKYTCIALQKLRNDTKDKTQKRIKNDELFSLLVKLIVEPPKDLGKWFMFAEQALGVIYTLSEKPDIWVGEMFGTLSRSMLGTVNESLMCRYVFLIGHVALKHVIYIDEIISALKRERIELKEKEKAEKRNQDAADKELDQIQGEDEGIEDEKQMLAEKELLSESTIIGNLAKIVIGLAKSLKTYSPLLQNVIVLSMCKLMMIEESFTATHLHILGQEIFDSTTIESIKSNIVICLGDLHVRFPNIFRSDSTNNNITTNQYTLKIFEQLKDESPKARKNAFTVLTHLILSGMVKTKQICDMAICLEDKDPVIVNHARSFFTKINEKSENELFNLLPDIISRLNLENVNLTSDQIREILKYFFSFITRVKQNESLVEKLCSRFKDTRRISESQNLAYCLQMIPYTDKSLEKLLESYKTFQDKLHDPETKEYMSQIITKCRKLPKKSGEMKRIIYELEKKFEIQSEGQEDMGDGDDMDIENITNNQNNSGKVPSQPRGKGSKKPPATRGAKKPAATRGKKKQIIESSEEEEDDDDDDEIDSDSDSDSSPPPPPPSTSKRSKQAPTNRGSKKQIIESSESDQDNDSDDSQDDSPPPPTSKRIVKKAPSKPPPKSSKKKAAAKRKHTSSSEEDDESDD